MGISFEMLPIVRPVVPVYPPPTDVREGVKYGPTGKEYVGRMPIVAAVVERQTVVSCVDLRGCQRC